MSPRLPALCEGIESPVKSFTPSRLTLRSFVRVHKSVQRHLVSRGNTTSTFSKPHSGVRSDLSEAPRRMFLRSVGFLEREQQPRDHHWEIPKIYVAQTLWFRKSRGIRTYTMFPLLRGAQFGERRKCALMCHHLRGGKQLDYGLQKSKQAAKRR